MCKTAKFFLEKNDIFNKKKMLCNLPKKWESEKLSIYCMPFRGIEVEGWVFVSDVLISQNSFLILDA